VKNEERLRALIAEARQRADDTSAKQLRAFQQQVEEMLSRELCDILEIGYQGDGRTEPLRAVFRVGRHEWTLTEDNGTPAWEVRFSPPLRVDVHATQERFAFNTRDELLLQLDEALQSERR
jgi:hypothetical protein